MHALFTNTVDNSFRDRAVVVKDANTFTTNHKHKINIFCMLIGYCWHYLTFQQLLCIFTIRGFGCIPHPALDNSLFLPTSRHFDALHLGTRVAPPIAQHSVCLLSDPLDGAFCQVNIVKTNQI